jgi:hypothetical protein
VIHTTIVGLVVLRIINQVRDEDDQV